MDGASIQHAGARAAWDFLARIETGDDTDVAEAFAEFRACPSAHLALGEIYDLPTSDGRLAFSLDDCEPLSRKRGRYSFVVTAETRPDQGWGPTQPLVVKLLLPSCHHDPAALAALAGEASVSRRWKQYGFKYASPLALVTLRAPGVPLDDWLANREWLKDDDAIVSDSQLPQRIEAVRQIGVALCRALQELHSAAAEGHGNLKLDSILVADDPNGMRINLVDIGADEEQAVPAEPALDAADGANYPAAVQQDAYDVGLAMLQVATPYWIEPDPTKNKAVIQRSLTPLWGTVPGFARVIEDLVDGKPDQRLAMLTKGEPSAEPWVELESLIEGEYELLTLFRPPTDRAGGHEASVASWSQVRRYFEVARKIKLGVRANWPASNLLKWLNLLSYSFWVLAFSGFVLLTSADIGLSTPDGAAKEFVEDNARFTLGEFTENFPGRAVALSFAYLALTYYMRLLAGVTVRGLGLPWIELSLRSVPIVLNVPIVLVIFYDPQWWPVASAFGLAATVVVNWMMSDLDRKAVTVMEDPLAYDEGALAKAAEARSQHANWWKTLIAYLILVITLAVGLYWTDLLHDDAFYAALLVIGCNFYAVYFNSIKKLGREVRGCLEQSSFVLRRAARLDGSESSPTIFALSKFRGGTLAFIPAAAVLALTVYLASTDHRATTALVLAGVAVAGVVTGLVALLKVGERRGDDVPMILRGALAIAAGALAWAAVSIGLVWVGGGWWRLLALLGASAIGVFVGDQVFRRSFPEAGEEAGEEAPEEEASNEIVADAFAAADERLRRGEAPQTVSADLGYALIGATDRTPAEVEDKLLVAWQTAPRLGRLAELLLLRRPPPPDGRRTIDSSAALADARAEVERGDKPLGLFAPATRAEVCLLPGERLSPSDARRFGAIEAVGMFFGALCVIGWAYFMVTDLDWIRSAGRTLALSYALTGVYYYRLLVGWVTVSAIGRRRTELVLRSVPAVLLVPATTATFFWPAQWPLQATFGMAGVVVANYLMWKLIDDAATRLEKQGGWSNAEAAELRATPFASWWTTAAMYTAALVMFDLLLIAWPVLDDAAVYALVLALGANLYVIDESSLRRNGASVRGQVTRAVVLLRVLPAPKPEHESKRGIRVGAPAALLGLQAAIAAAAALALELVEPDASSWSPWATALLIATAVALAATIGVQYRESDVASPRGQAMGRFAAVLAVWGAGIATFFVAGALDLPAIPVFVLLACLAVAAVAREERPNRRRVRWQR